MVLLIDLSGSYADEIWRASIELRSLFQIAQPKTIILQNLKKHPLLIATFLALFAVRLLCPQAKITGKLCIPVACLPGFTR